MNVGRLGVVALVEDHRLLAQSLAMSLRHAGFTVVVLDPCDEVVQRARDCGAALVLLDLNLGAPRSREGGGAEDPPHGPVAGDDLIHGLVAAGCAVLVLTGEHDEARWGSCLLNGATGVLHKAAPLSVVTSAVAQALQGGQVGDVAERQRWMRAADRHRADADRDLAPFRRLTPREQEVLASMVEGEHASDIAARITVSEATVRSHIRSVLAKLGVVSQLQAVAQARRVGWSRRRGHDAP